MRKITLALAFALSIISINSFAQFVGSGGTSTVAGASQRVDRGDWKNRFTLYFGPSLPTGMWNQSPDASSTLSEMYTNNAGFGARRGVYFEMGSMFYLRNLRLVEQMGVAINVTYVNLNINSFDWTPFVSDQMSIHTPFISVGTKFGATYSYKIMDKMWVDGYFNLCPSLVFLPESESTYLSADTYRYDYNIYTDLVVPVRRNIGVNFRYSVFTVGLDYLFGGINSTVYQTVYDNQTSTLIQDLVYETKFRANTLQLKLGFTF